MARRLDADAQPHDADAQPHTQQLSTLRRAPPHPAHFIPSYPPRTTGCPDTDKDDLATAVPSGCSTAVSTCGGSSGASCRSASSCSSMASVAWSLTTSAIFACTVSSNAPERSCAVASWLCSPMTASSLSASAWRMIGRVRIGSGVRNGGGFAMPLGAGLLLGWSPTERSCFLSLFWRSEARAL